MIYPLYLLYLLLILVLCRHKKLLQYLFPSPSGLQSASLTHWAQLRNPQFSLFLLKIFARPHSPLTWSWHLPPDEASLGQSLSVPQELRDGPKKRLVDRGTDTERGKTISTFILSQTYDWR